VSVRLAAIAPGGLPVWCDAYLAPPGQGDVFAGRAWFETLIAHALPPDARAEFALCGESALLPLLRVAGRLGPLTAPYTLTAGPLFVTGTADGGAAGHLLGRWLRGAPPLHLDCLDPEAPGMEPFLQGIARAGVQVHRFDHFGNWYEPIPDGTGWTEYLAGRSPALQNTITRKLRAAARSLDFEWITRPGAALEDGITGYEEVRSRSWKPREPFPDFDRALMRAIVGTGELRLGLLRRRADRTAVAAQYWAVSGGRAAVLKLAHVEAERTASPGTVLTAMMIARLLDEERVRELDFGRGDDAYKRLWVRRRRQRIGVVLADPRHPAGLAAIGRQLAGEARRRLARWLGRGETADRQAP